MTPDLMAVQGVAVVLFCLGIAVAMTRRNIFFILMGVELAINAANLSFIGFSRTLPAAMSLTGQVVPLFAIAVAAAEACVGLAMVILIYRARESLDSESFANLKE
jgi:NADH:ubiquinone oxidoreductase subunit K